MMNAPIVEIRLYACQPADAWYSKMRRGMPERPAECCTRNVVWKPMSVSQKATLPIRSESMRPVSFGNQ